MNIVTARNYDQLSSQAALIVAGEILQHPTGVFGFATGSTPLGLYGELVRLHNENLLDFSQLRTFNLDEYYGMDGRNEHSYAAFMREHLFSKVNIDPAAVGIPNGAAPDPKAECARYEQQIAAAGGIRLQVLGIGHNGHIAFNEPDDHFPPHTHHVKLTQSTIDANARFYSSADEVPKSALSMGIGTIMHAKKILLLVSGEAKRDILLQSLNGPVTPHVPASVLQLHPDVTLITDFALT